LYNLAETPWDKSYHLHWTAMSLHAQGKFREALVKSEELIKKYPDVKGITNHGYALKGVHGTKCQIRALASCTHKY